MGKLDKILAQFQNGTNPAHRLPPAAYRSKGFWKKECKTILTENWVCVGAAHELKSPGDVVPVTVAEQPLVLVRQQGGEITAFHNICRHRCMTLVEDRRGIVARVGRQRACVSGKNRCRRNGNEGRSH